MVVSFAMELNEGSLYWHDESADAVSMAVGRDGARNLCRAVGAKIRGVFGDSNWTLELIGPLS